MSDYGGALGLCERATKQPDRHPDDQNVTLTWQGYQIVISHGSESITLSAFNAWRVFAMLSMMLGLPLPKRIQKMINL